METTTFYSYKGGLGRSLLVAWATRALASRGHTVVAADFDLEAPGLPFKLGFSEEAELGPGIVDLVLRYQRSAVPPADLWPWLRPVPGYAKAWVLPAGPGPSQGYWQSLAAVSWESLFFGEDAQGARFFAWLREKIEDTVGADHLLIDSRTGVTELGGAALSLLPDRVLALTGTSKESLIGTREILRAVVAAAGDSSHLAVALARMPPTLPVSELEALIEHARAFIQQEAEPLSATVRIQPPLPICSEPVLQVDEMRALAGERLSVHQDYEAVLGWLTGAPPAAPHPRLSFRPPPLGRDAMATLQQSIVVQRVLATNGGAPALESLATSLGHLADELESALRWSEADEVRREQLALLDSLLSPYLSGEEPPSPHALPTALSMLRALLDQARTARRVTEPDTSGREHQDALSLARRIVQAWPGDADLNEVAASTAASMGELLDREGQTSRAREYTEFASEVLQRLVQREPDRPDRLRDLSVSFVSLGDLHRALGDGERARRCYQDALDTAQRLVQREPDRSDRLHDLSVSYNKLGDLHLALGDGERARRYYEDALEIVRRLVQREPDRSDRQRDLSVSYNKLGDLHRALGDGERARRYYEDALEIRQRLAQREPERSDMLRDLSVSFERLGDLHRARGDGERARRHYEDALEIAHRLVQREPDHFDRQGDLAISFERMAQVDPPAAASWLDRAIEIRRARARLAPQFAVVHRELAVSLVQRWGVEQGPAALLAEAHRLLEDLAQRGALEAERQPLLDWLRAMVVGGGP